jgi:hypothetical protein
MRVACVVKFENRKLVGCRFSNWRPQWAVGMENLGIWNGNSGSPLKLPDVLCCFSSLTVSAQQKSYRAYFPVSLMNLGT